MSFDYPDAFAAIEDIVMSTSDVRKGMNRLMDYCDSHLPNPVWAKIRSLAFETDLEKLKTWLEGVLTMQPPPTEINGFWFGIFNPVLSSGEVSCQLYVSGSNKFNPDDQTIDWAVWDADSYLPEKRSANSKILHEIYRLLQENNVSGDGEYIACLGYACLAVKAACRTLNPALLLGERSTRAIVVGFDSGDWIVLK